MCSVISIFGPWCIREFRWLKTFSYSEKATIICAIFLMVWTLKKQTFKPWGKLCKFLWLSQKSWTLLSWIMFATLFMTRFHEFLIFEAFFNFISKTFFDWFLNYKIINFCAQKKVLFKVPNWISVYIFCFVHFQNHELERLSLVQKNVFHFQIFT